jgi:hypothetical protein
VAVSRIWSLEPRGYANHPLHADDRTWKETNCYVDLWVELLHALGVDPRAALAFTLASDFEGDQWTFFKFPLEDLRALFGLEVHELNIWRSLVHHLDEQVQQGRPVIVEVDSFFLPDTAGVSYQREHVKTSVAVQEIDIAGRRLGYFHGPSYFALEGQDFDGAFRLDRAGDPAVLAPYVEVVKLHALERPPADELRRRAAALLSFHLRRRPRANPVVRYRQRFEADIAWLKGEPLAMFHQYAFATLRQLGANFELAGTFLRWLDQGVDAAPHFDAISSSAKTLMLKTARAVTSKKPVDLSQLLSAMEEAWQQGIDQLAARYGG